jgi:HEAT repeat protein
MLKVFDEPHRVRRGVRRLTLVAASAVALVVTGVAPAPVTAQPPAPPLSESQLLEVLRSDAPEADKAITCKRLAVVGSAAAVGDLAKLLANERLASWARIPLEVIPGPEADAALREAASRLSGRQAVGVINSIGVRRDAKAVPLLSERIVASGPGDTAVAAAAAAALGRIGTAEAAVALSGYLAASLSGGLPASLQDDLAEACVVCAEARHAAGQTGEAVALFDAVRTAKVSDQRRAEATRGGILARGGDGIPLLVETLRSPEPRLARMGLFTARELGRGERPDAAVAEAVDRGLVAELEAAIASGSGLDRAVLVADVLADRNAGGGRPAVQAALLAAAATGPKPVRLAAIDAVGRAGDAAAVAPLLEIAADPDAGYAVAARGAIAALPAGMVDGVIRGRLATATPRELPLLVGVVGDRRIPATAELVGLVKHADESVRSAAVEALGQVVDLENLGVLVAEAVAARSEAAAAAARKALVTASIRMPDRDACVETLVAGFGAASDDAKVVLLDTIGEVGGARALAVLRRVAGSGDPRLDDAATRLLGKWMTADAAPVLLELAGPDSPSKFRTRALRGYLRIARQFDMPPPERAAMCRAALAVAQDDVDRTAVLEILKRYPAPATLEVAEEAGKVPGLAEEAAKAAEEIRGKLPNRG